MKKFCMAIFKTGKDHQDALCVFSMILAVLFGLPIIGTMIRLFTNMWTTQYKPVINPYSTLEMFQIAGEILLAAAFLILAIQLLKAPHHPLTSVSCGTVAISHWVTGITNFVYHYAIMPSQNIFTAGSSNIAADAYTIIVPALFYTLTILCGFLWILPITAGKKATEKGLWLWVFLPLILFLCQIIISIFTGSFSSGYIFRNLAYTALLISLNILLFGNGPKAALDTLKQLKER